jgi:hypothetical protein
MHKTFYASGFLYHPKTQQILLQQNNLDNKNREWTLFNGENLNGEGIKEAFLRIINDNLNLKLKINSIYTIYDYTYKGKDVYILYAHIRKLEEFSHRSKIFSWFNFKNIRKLTLSDQSKQDITVGQRVIDSNIRKDLGLQTIG